MHVASTRWRCLSVRPSLVLSSDSFGRRSWSYFAHFYKRKLLAAVSLKKNFSCRRGTARTFRVLFGTFSYYLCRPAASGMAQRDYVLLMMWPLFNGFPSQDGIGPATRHLQFLLRISQAIMINCEIPFSLTRMSDWYNEHVLAIACLFVLWAMLHGCKQ